MFAYSAPVFALSPAAPTFSIAYYYANNPPLDELHAFDIVVVDPDTVGVTPKAYNTSHSQLFAYLSVGEVDTSRAWFSSVKASWIIAENSAWKSKVVDLANPEWRTFFLDTLFEPLWNAGYRGFFLDTLDSYQQIKDEKLRSGLESGLIELIRDIKQRHPDARLIMNRGFEILDKVKDGVPYPIKIIRMALELTGDLVE
jgi:hypothetical protein